MILAKLKSPKFILLFVSLVVALALLALPTAPAAAEGQGPLTPIAGLGRIPNATLHHMLLRERAWMNSQTTIFRDANNLATAFQSLIDYEKKRGKDVTGLETALSDFNAELKVAGEIYTTAVKILVANSGFDGSFNVIDRAAAGETFLSARDNLRDAHFRLVTAMNKLRTSYKRWLNHNL